MSARMGCVVAGLAALALHAPGYAQVYQCKDQNGRAVFTDKPCAGELQEAGGQAEDLGGPIRPEQLYLMESQYRVKVARMLNRLATEHAQCRERMSPETAGVSRDYSTPENPSFFVQCGDRQVPTVVRFSMRDIDGRGSIAVPVQIERRAAIGRCEQEARDRAYRGDSVDFSRILDLAFNTRPNGESTVLSSFTAENAFGVETKFDIRCDFSGERLRDVSISRAR
ncbi:MAG TPA: hypothetical protein DEP32_11860 [Pseudomonas sp.]|nr:hypothetical protein [Paracoccaceae bacterium]MAQ51694.1 hypothetical protein [Pseudomonas sp.]MBB51194.1 hypothetical protein [Pseudomonadales bacterium]MBB52288.1 hypothetical protein [Pseudomonadales bacterium]HCA24849.1 hypothetical protein [Pseudomonas sp.]